MFLYLFFFFLAASKYQSVNKDDIQTAVTFLPMNITSGAIEQYFTFLEILIYAGINLDFAIFRDKKASDQ